MRGRGAAVGGQAVCSGARLEIPARDVIGTERPAGRGAQVDGGRCRAVCVRSALVFVAIVAAGRVQAQLPLPDDATALQPSGELRRQADELQETAPHIFVRQAPRATPTPDCVGNREPVTNPTPLGSVMTSVAAYLVFWLPSGVQFEPGAGGDLNYQRLLERYFQDVGGSSFYDILTQYYGSNGTPMNAVSIGGMIVDTTRYPRDGTTSDPLLDSDIEDEILNLINAQSWPVGLSAMYFVYTGYAIQSCMDASRTCCTYATASSPGYCAYHNVFGVIDEMNRQFPVIYANMPDVLSIAPNGECGIASPNGDAYADTEINATSHEQFEGASDPLSDAWADAEGCEIADKCEMPFHTSSPDVSLNGNPYYVQKEWSNAAGGCTLNGPPTPTMPPTTCVGDCDHSGMVTISELVTGVDIALGSLPVGSCPAFDCNGNGDVGVDCLVRAVNAALDGCSAG